MHGMLHPINPPQTNSDTVEFISTVISIPNTSSEDYIRQAITEIISLLADPKPTVTSHSLADDAQSTVT